MATALPYPKQTTSFALPETEQRYFGGVKLPAPTATTTTSTTKLPTPTTAQPTGTTASPTTMLPGQNPVLLPSTAPNMDPVALPGQNPVTLPATGVTVDPTLQVPTPGPLPSPAYSAQQSTVQPFGPEADLRYQSVLPDPSVDRFGLAQDRFDQFAESTNPAYEAALRAATQRAAASGRLGSGMLTTTYGDYASNRARELDLARQGFLTDALEGTIGDARSDRSELRGERDYQYGVSRQAIEDEIRNLLVGDQLTDSAFDRQTRLASLLASLGYAGNPDQTLLAGSNQQQQSADQMYQLIAALAGQLGQG